MPLTLPNLDDRTYADLVEDARRLIPAYAPEWTDHNPSDPGVTLIEMFAYLSEMLIYRTNRVTPANIKAFLRLLNGPTWEPSTTKTLAEEIRDTVQTFRQTSRAVTCADFEWLALAVTGVGRARCVGRRNFEFEDPKLRNTDRPGHVSLAIVPADLALDAGSMTDLLEHVSNQLEQTRLLTTRLHVVPARYCAVRVRLTLHLQRDALVAVVGPQAVETLRAFLHPLVGGPDHSGWPFGRDVHVSDIYRLLDQLPGVDYLEKSLEADGNALDELVPADPDRRQPPVGQGDLVSIRVEPDELIDAQIIASDINVVGPS